MNSAKIEVQSDERRTRDDDNRFQAARGRSSCAYRNGDGVGIGDHGQRTVEVHDAGLSAA
jgi:hypothetical protein